MPTKSEWKKGFKKLEQGQSYGYVADWLGVSKSGLYERHEKYLADKVKKQEMRLEKVTGRRRSRSEDR